MREPRAGRRQGGVALLTVLLITALAVVLVTSMISRQRLSIAKTRQVVHTDQALVNALGAETWVRGLLHADLVEDEATPPVDGIGDRWYEPGTDFEVEGGVIEIRVRDLSGLLNLNAVDDAAGRDRLGRLLTNLGLDPGLAGAVADWTDGNLETSTLGAEDGAYLVETPPYRAANRPFASVTELRLLAGIDAETYERLVPYVAALPAGMRRVNVNTAPAPVLGALAPGLDPDRAADLALPGTPWPQVGELVGREAAFAPETGVLATASRFFEVLVRAEFGDRAVTLRSIVHRDPETARTRVLARDLGRRFASWARAPAPEDD